MPRDDAGGVAGDPYEQPDDERPDDEPGLDPGASMVPPPRDTGSKSARAEQAKSVGGATGELAEDDGLLQTNQVDRGGVDRLAEAARPDEEDDRAPDERRADDLDRQSRTAELSPDDLDDEE